MIKKSAAAISAQLKRVVKSGDNSHFTLEERQKYHFDVIEDIGVLLRIRLKDKNPPCIITFRTEAGDNNKIFKVFYSHDLREPNEQTNHGSEVNVSDRFCSHQ